MYIVEINNDMNRILTSSVAAIPTPLPVVLVVLLLLLFPSAVSFPIVSEEGFRECAALLLAVEVTAPVEETIS